MLRNFSASPHIDKETSKTIMTEWQICTFSDLRFKSVSLVWCEKVLSRFYHEF